MKKTTGRPRKYPWPKWMRLGVTRTVDAKAWGVPATHLRQAISDAARTRKLRAVTTVRGDVVRFRIIEAV